MTVKDPYRAGWRAGVRQAIIDTEAEARRIEEDEGLKSDVPVILRRHANHLRKLLR